MADQVILMVVGLFGLKNDHSIQYLMKIIWEQAYCLYAPVAQLAIRRRKALRCGASLGSSILPRI